MTSKELLAFARALQPIIMLKYHSNLNILITMQDIENIIATPEFEEKYKSYYQQMHQGINSDTEPDSNPAEPPTTQTSSTESAAPQNQGTATNANSKPDLIAELIADTACVNLDNDGSVELRLGDLLAGRNLTDPIVVRNLLIDAVTKKLDFLEKKRMNIDGLDIAMAKRGAYTSPFDKNELKKLDKKIANLSAGLDWLQRTTRKRGVFKKKRADEFSINKLISVFDSHNIRCNLERGSDEIKYNFVNSITSRRLFQKAVKEKLNSRFLPKDFYPIVNSYAKNNLGAQCTEDQFQAGIEYCATRFNHTELKNPIKLRDSDSIFESSIQQGFTQNKPVYDFLIDIAADMETNGLKNEYFKNWVWNKKSQKKIIQNIKYAATEIGQDGRYVSLSDIVNAGNRYHIIIDPSGLPKAPNSNNQAAPNGYGPQPQNQDGVSVEQDNPLYENNEYDAYEYDPSDPSGY